MTTTKIVKTVAEWRAVLTHEQYRLTRETGDEVPFAGAYWETWTAGTYECVCCRAPLFDADAKFDAETGWPSFSEPINDEAFCFRDSNGEVEVLCSRCDASVGHGYDDGPLPTGHRYCFNSAGMALAPAAHSDDARRGAARQPPYPSGRPQGQTEITSNRLRVSPPWRHRGKS